VPRIAFGVLAVATLGAALFSVEQARAQTADSTQPASETIDAQTSLAASAFDPHNPDHVEARVRAYFSDIPIMAEIARCESGFHMYDEYGNPLYGGTGGMVGVFQEAAAIHNDTAKELGLNINTLEGNLAYARYLYENQGLAPWYASSKCWSPIKSVLQQGSTGQQVVVLQKILNSNGYVIAQDGPGSPGQESVTFGPMTVDAVKRFQCTMGIVCKGTPQSTGYGMVGQKTRMALLKLDIKVALATSSSLSLR
jgi:hypothetical protein